MKYAVNRSPALGKVRVFCPVSVDEVYVVHLVEFEKGTKTAEGGLFEMGKSDLEHFEPNVVRWLRGNGVDLEAMED